MNINNCIVKNSENRNFLQLFAVMVMKNSVYLSHFVTKEAIRHLYNYRNIIT